MFVKNDINELNLNKIQDDEMALSEHIEEFSQRIIFCLILLLLSTLPVSYTHLTLPTIYSV